MSNNIYDEVSKEKKFSYENITREQRDFCIHLLEHCKDVCDTENKINGVGKGNLIQVDFSKVGGPINANGSFCVGKENRLMDADIYIRQNKVLVSMNVIRLGYVGENKEYNVVDEFEIKDDKLIRKSYYNYDKKSFIQYVEDEELKSRIK